MRIVFMGTPEFAVPSLEALINEGYEIIAVITQPDKPKGRGHKLSSPPVKEFAIKSGIMVLQPEKIKNGEFPDKLKLLNPELLITVAYGKILSKEILDIPKYGCINVHGSLLPKYRGPAPIHWAIINGESETGITTMMTDVGLDTGDILLKETVKITDDITVGELHDKMAILGGKVLIDTLKKLEQGNLDRIKQNDDESTYAPLIGKDTGKINWNMPIKSIHNIVRGTNPWPSAFTYYQGQKMKIFESQIAEIHYKRQTPGIIVKVEEDGIVVACKDGLLKITEVQFDSSKKMAVREYIKGHKICEGEILG